MGLIYVNPEGPNGKPDPFAAARDIRATFARMAMNDEETVALIAGGTHFRQGPRRSGPRQVRRSGARGGVDRGAGLRLEDSFGSGKGVDAISSGLEGAWTTHPTRWDNNYFDNLFGYEWELTRSPAGARQWTPRNAAGAKTVPDAHDPAQRHAPVMFTTDLALRIDPAYERISRRFSTHPEEFAEAFAKAWYKLTHRDMGPLSRYLGPLVPNESLLWQDPVPHATHPTVNAADIATLKGSILSSGLTVSQLVTTAWASAATFRGSDKRGGANGARIGLAPQKDWAVNQPAGLAQVLKALAAIQAEFNATSAARKVSLADLIVLGGCAAIEQAARAAGHAVTVPFSPGRTDATQEQTDVQAFAVLEPAADGFRNYRRSGQTSSPKRCWWTGPSC